MKFLPLKILTLSLGRLQKPLRISTPNQVALRYGKLFNHVVQEKVAKGEYRLQCIAAEILGTPRPIEVYRATRAPNTILKPWQANTDDDSYCPAHWADIAIGRGACGFRCRACFLMLTHRTFADPSRHVLYENVGDYEQVVRKELMRLRPVIIPPA
jgi:hypothetical protein